MWDRKTLKDNAKEILKKNYWMAVVVALIMGAVLSNGTGTKILSNRSGNDSSGIGWENQYHLQDNLDENYNIKTTYTYGKESLSSSLFGEYDNWTDSVKQLEDRFNMSWKMIVCIVVMILFVSCLINIFVKNVLSVGCRRWFVINKTDNPELGEIIHPFKYGYFNVVKTMFLMNLYLVLWGFLLVIPMFIKFYEYRMVPYLLAENPQMSSKEAFETSAYMMDGNKWNVFVLDLSFLGWMFLAMFTFGILNVFYVDPYIQTTQAELYIALCQENNSNTTEHNYNMYY